MLISRADKQRVMHC